MYQAYICLVSYFTFVIISIICTLHLLLFHMLTTAPLIVLCCLKTEIKDSCAFWGLLHSCILEQGGFQLVAMAAVEQAAEVANVAG